MSRALELRDTSRKLFEDGDLGGAARAAGQAIEEMEKAVGKEHPDYADMLVNFAELSIEGGEYVGSLELCRRAMTIYEASPGREDATAIALRTASLAHRALGQFPRAHELLVRALAIVKNPELEHAIQGDVEELG